jgi:hypothetical protein
LNSLPRGEMSPVAGGADSLLTAPAIVGARPTERPRNA